MNIYKLLIPLLCLVALISCEKDIDIDMPDYERQLMVEGFIINNKPSILILTSNYEYTEQAGLELYENSFIHDAQITITDGNGDSEVLNEISNYDEILDYTSYMYVGSTLIGQLGNTYTLTIEVEGKIIVAETYIPDLVDILDIWGEPHPDAQNDSMKIVKCKINDPTEKNYYRYLYEINGFDGASPERSTVDDSYFNGKEYIKAIDSGLENEEQDIHGGVAGYFYIGDTITVNWMNVEKSYYDFWTTIDFRRTTETSPFMSPTKVPGNVGGALGHWSGIALSQKKIIL